jgi:Protein kinase domain
MSDVVVAWDAPLERDVVVKLLAAERCRDAVSRRRFAREAAAAARLAPHPYALGVLDSGEWRGRPYLVLEYLPGGSVGDRLVAGPAPPRALALRWLAQAADALDEAHARGLVHRDVKPANLLLDERDDIRVADFGIARDADETGLTLTGEILGTAGYLAPEQARGEPASAASDRYALAVVARELLGPERQPPAVEAVLERGSEDDPHRRYATASEFVVRLTDAFENPPAPTRVEAVPELECRHPHRARRPLLRFVALVAVLALMASSALGALVVQRLRGASPTSGRTPVGTCTLSPLDHDANAVARGPGAIAFCREAARQLTSSDVVWSYRTGRRLLVPDGGDLSRLGLVCDAVVGGLSVRVYDDGSRSLGAGLCRGFARRGGQVTQLAAF